MLRFIYGPSGFGKSAAIAEGVKESLSRNRRVFVLVPEQYVLTTERRIADITEDIPTVGLEVLSFRRLANRVFREHGGLAYHYIDRGGSALIMWRTLTELSPLLTEYSDISLSDRALIKLMLDTVKELKSCGIRPHLIERASVNLREADPRLSAKLSDLSLIYSTYENTLKQDFDDPRDDLTKLAEKLNCHNFFSSCDVYIDSFNSFTGQERDVLRHILKQADSVTLSLAYTKGDRQLMFENLSGTERFFRDCAESCRIKIEELQLTFPHRFRTAELTALEASLRRYDIEKPTPIPDPAPSIRIIEASGMFTEAEAVCKDILARVQSGAHYKDFMIAARGISAYEGIIDAVAEKHGIPLFMSKRTDIKSKPLIRFILTALGILRRGWSGKDVIAFVKCGFSNLTDAECDLLEAYVSTWNISGRRWHDGEDWIMSPEGFSAEITEETLAKLAKINEIKNKLTAPLIDLSEAFRQGNVRSVSRALYEMLKAYDVGKKLSSIASEEDVREGEETLRLWQITMDALDRLVELAGDVECTPELYAGMLELLLDESDMGSIPTTLDQVTAGEASLIRADSIEHLYVLGANDGTFPAIPSDGGFFSDRDRELLLDAGVELNLGSEYRMGEELFFFYRTVTTPRSSLTLLYPASDMMGTPLRSSYMLDRIREIFPSIKLERYADFPPEALLYEANSSFEYAALYENTPIGDALRSYYEGNPAYSDRLRSLDMPLSVTEETISPELACSLFGGDISFTQSRLDSYILCKFGYFCRYVTGLKERAVGSFGSADVGNFIHHVLERYMRSALKNGVFHVPSEDESHEMVDRIVDEYIDSICRDRRKTERRLLHLFEKLRAAVRILVRNLGEEFEQSDFTPRFFELPIGIGTEDYVAPLTIPLPDGTSAYLRGIADRVDTYEKDGKLYIRIVDYKTGSKDFSLADVAMGLNLQMLLYLFSLWQTRDDHFTEKLGCTQGDILPAGVLYFGAHLPLISSDIPMTTEEITAEATDSIQRKGLFIDDPDILRAMDKNLSGKYIPVRMKKDGGFYSGTPITSIAGFGEIMNQITSIIERVSSELKSGDASVKPLKTHTRDACQYCRFKPVCRKI
ncbi:MAG: PD-(D/E)XK nuclease family protein [Clostridia bacterium]|nr:PD-(D/E)XK nuclease family protein [Clostridia bacterium]